MLAATFSRPGDPSVLRVDDVPEPDPPTGDRILVRVAASSINGTDLGLRRGAPGSAVFGRMVRPGFDLVGEVVGCGDAVTAFEPGDRVAALLPHSGAGRPSRWCCASAAPPASPRRWPRRTPPGYRSPG